MNIPLIFIGLGLLVFFGFLANIGFSRTLIPDSLLLVLMGLLLNQLGLVNASDFLPFAGFAASLAVAVILFEAGLNLDIKSIASELASALNLGTLSFLFSSAFITLAVHFTLGWNFLLSMLVGFLLGGTSAAIVIPIAQSLKLSDNQLALLGLESTVTNMYNVVFALSVAQLIKEATISVENAANAVLASFSIGAVLGAVAGYFWIQALRKLRGMPFSYMLTLAFLFIVYGITEFARGSGAVAALVFGLLLGNMRALTRVFPIKTVSPSKFVQFHEEITFLIRTYFFLFLGIILQIPKNVLLWKGAFGILLAALIGRFLAVKLLKLDLLYATLIPRGLSEAVVASLLIQMQLPHAYEIVQLVGLTILLTNLLTAILLRFHIKNGKKANKKEG